MSGKHLVVFDVDGTLTDTNAVGAEGFWRATREVLSLPNEHSQWLEQVEHYTDLGMASQHCKAAFGRDITAAETDLLKRRLVELLEAAALTNPESIRAMPGAAAVLAALRTRSDCAAVRYFFVIAGSANRSGLSLRKIEIRRHNQYAAHPWKIALLAPPLLRYQ